MWQKNLPIFMFWQFTHIMVYTSWWPHVAQMCHEFTWKCRVSGDLKFHLKIAAVKQLLILSFQAGSLLILILLFGPCPMWMWAVLLTLWMYMLLLMNTWLSRSVFSFTIRMGAVDTPEKSTTLAVYTRCNDPRAESTSTLLSNPRNE